MNIEEYSTPLEYLQDLHDQINQKIKPYLIQELTDEVNEIENKNSIIIDSKNPKEYLQKYWENFSSSDEIKKFVATNINSVNEFTFNSILEGTIKPKKETKFTKYNPDGQMKDHLMDIYQLRQKEILHKIKELENKIENEDPSATKNIIANLHDELEKLQPFLESISPKLHNDKKKVKFLKNSEIENRFYTPEKIQKSKKFVSEIQKKVTDAKEELYKIKSVREQYNQQKLESLKKEILAMEEKERDDKKKACEERLKAIQAREEERIRKFWEWKEEYEKLKKSKPLYEKKEEEFKQYEKKIQKEEDKIIEARVKYMHPLPDNLFKEHAKNTEEILKIISKRNHLLKSKRSNSHSSLKKYRYSKFYDIYRQEEEAMKLLEKEKETKPKELRDRLLYYSEHVRKDIIVNTKKWEPNTTPMITSFLASTPLINKKKLSMQEAARKMSLSTPKAKIYLIPKKAKSKPAIILRDMTETDQDNLENIKKIRKSLHAKSARNLSNNVSMTNFGDSTTTGSNNTNVKTLNNGSSNSLMTLTPKPPKKMNYLPYVRKNLKSTNKRKNFFDDIIANTKMDNYEKYEKLKLGMKRLEDGVFVLENEIRKNRDQDYEKKYQKQENVDQFYLDAIKAKIAIINKVGNMDDANE